MDERFLILSIETATGCGSVALTRGGVENGRLLAEATAQPEVSHSRRLLGSVQWVMQAAGKEWGDLHGVAVSLGPGSFTGLRIGMAAAKGIVMAADVPLLGVPTLDVMALSFPLIDRPLWCLLDARKQEVYAACYLPGKDYRPEPAGPVEAIRPGQLAALISESVILAGSGVDTYHETFSQIKNARLVPALLSYPMAARVGYLAAEMLVAGRIMNPATAAPMYVRASEAEVNFKK